MIESGRYKWPEDFPEGIPGENTVPASGKVYRLVSSIPPTEEDFKMHKIDNPRYNYKHDDEDKAYGVSFWSILEKCLEAKKKYAAPEQFGNKHIAYGNLNPDLGVIPKEPSKNGHLTLWKQIDAKPHLYVCNEETLS